MTLQDAHKTGRKYRIIGGGQDYFRWPDEACVSLEKLFAEYEVEPQVYEVECVVSEVGGSLVVLGEISFEQTLPRDIEGKRVKATFEVID